MNKYIDAPDSTISRDTTELEVGTSNIYESVAIISKRADQISSQMKEELSAKLDEFASDTDNLEEVFENREQIEISRFYERLPKTNAIALKEFLDDKVYFRNPADDSEEEE